MYDEINYNVDMMTSNFEMDFFSKETLSAIDSKRSLAKSYAAFGVGHWTNLPGTLNEIKAIEKIIDGSVLVAGQEVAEHTVKSMSESGELANYKFIHFATHGLTTSAFPELSAIVLSQLKDSPSKEDGYLRMGEIANLKLNADFVNLSACETGLGKIYGGEGVVGLSQSFLLAGANGLSVSLWQVSDQSTKLFMEGVYLLVKDKGLGYSAAISFMKRVFIHYGDHAKAIDAPGVINFENGNTKPLKHPYYWAPFVFYGMN